MNSHLVWVKRPAKRKKKQKWKNRRAHALFTKENKRRNKKKRITNASRCFVTCSKDSAIVIKNDQTIRHTILNKRPIELFAIIRKKLVKQLKIANELNLFFSNSFSLFHFNLHSDTQVTTQKTPERRMEQEWKKKLHSFNGFFFVDLLVELIGFSVLYLSSSWALPALEQHRKPIEISPHWLNRINHFAWIIWITVWSIHKALKGIKF